ncbi:hypothetical protein [Streptomyces sp. NPDC006274]|uniref:hypothetical protein n=1 Tax=unclassified Streptomyces TaxID=2593676 RepID=UPI0033B7C459
MHIFIADRLCITVEGVDFHNPNRPQDGRECGARLELRFVERDNLPGSIYVSRALSLARAVCRFDFLESAPGKQDRMHWHPAMEDGEAFKRLYDEDLSRDPLAWLGERLRDGVRTLELGGVEDSGRFADDAEALALLADAIVAETAATLDGFRRSGWPPVTGRDERGMAVRTRSGAAGTAS